MKVEQSENPSLMTLHIRRARGSDTVPCRMTLQKATGLVVSEVCEDGNGGSVAMISSGVIAPHRLKLFLPEAACWFNGCAELRAAYFRDIEQLPPDCPMCEQGKIQRRYLDYMAELGV